HDLQEECIAQTPLLDRTDCKLLVWDQANKEIMHRTFTDITAYLQPGDCLVLNNSRVIPVRLFGVKQETNAKIEILLLHETEKDTWEALVNQAKRVKVGTEIGFG